MISPQPLERCRLDAEGVTYCRDIRDLDEASALAWCAGAKDLSIDLMDYAAMTARDHLEQQFQSSR